MNFLFVTRTITVSVVSLCPGLNARITLPTHYFYCKCGGFLLVTNRTYFLIVPRLFFCPRPNTSLIRDHLTGPNRDKVHIGLCPVFLTHLPQVLTKESPFLFQPWVITVHWKTILQKCFRLKISSI